MKLQNKVQIKELTLLNN